MNEAGKSVWPSVGKLIGQSPDRNSFIGGSDANIILGGQDEAVLRLWREKRGELDPVDLSDVLPVAMGVWTEDFNRQWYEKMTGFDVSQQQASFTCPKNRWRRCTIDGFIDANFSVWEAKHTNAFAKSEDVLERYMPQLQHNMAVVGCERAEMSVIFGNHKFEIFEVAADWLYQRELLQAEKAFWACVLNGTQPVAAEVPPAPRPVGVREICLQGHNSWASAAADWLQYREAAKSHSAASTALKSLVEDDVARAFGHGIEAKRSKSGAITIRELVQ